MNIIAVKGILWRRGCPPRPNPELIRTKVNLLPPDITTVRVVEIEGLDVQADGGTHVASTPATMQIRRKREAGGD